MKHKFKVGDKVRIVADISGHCIKIGSIVQIELAPEDSSYFAKGGWFGNEECIAMSAGTATLRTSTKGFRFNLVAANNEKIATSEVYTTKAMALKTLKKYFPDFEIVDKTKVK